MKGLERERLGPAMTSLNNLLQLRCFVLAAEELHFGRAAQRLDMLPSAFGRFVRLLEEDLNTTLFVRTTRTVVLTEDGRQLLGEARKLLAHADSIEARFRDRLRLKATKLSVGAIDSAAAGLLPMLLNDFRKRRPDVEVQLLEDKTIRLLPRILSGRLDLAFVRPPKSIPQSLVCRHLFHETPVLAVATSHRLARRRKVTVKDMAGQPLIVPDRRARPHSHDLTIKLFEEAGVEPRIVQVADEKQTIVNLVSAGLGIAIVPRWTARMAVAGVSYLPVAIDKANKSRLPLAAVWMRGSRDALRDSLLDTLKENVERYAAQA
jgi:DNA-binding transcriptional LysR family regulator